MTPTATMTTTVAPPARSLHHHHQRYLSADNDYLNFTQFVRFADYPILQKDLAAAASRLSRDHMDFSSLQYLQTSCQPTSYPSYRPMSKKRLQRQGSQSKSVSSPSKFPRLEKPRSSTTSSDSMIKARTITESDNVPQYVKLSSWDQTSPRGHVRKVFCFPLKDGTGSAEAAVNHLEKSLQSLAESHPEFAGSLMVDSAPGSVKLCLRPNDCIPLMVERSESGFGYTYEALRAQGFPPQAFVGPRFAIDSAVVEGGKPIPVAAIKAILIQGGLLLMTYLHHTFADGEGMRLFLDILSAHSRGQKTSSKFTFDFEVVNPKVKKFADALSCKQLLDSCTEYVQLPNLAGPTQPILHPGGSDIASIGKTGKIFRFRNDKLEILQRFLAASKASWRKEHPPSTYTTLCGLTWAHVAQARMATENYASDVDRQGKARLMNPVNWKKRALAGATDDYFGNATTLSFTTVEVTRLQEACHSTERLAWLVNQINSSIDSIDDDYVCRRMALFNKISDPRSLGLDLDPRIPQDFGFNTWRYFGGDSDWRIPGTAMNCPEAVRRAQDSFNMGGCLILPVAKTSPVQELLVTLPEESMQRLLEDRSFMQWVDQVIG